MLTIAETPRLIIRQFSPDEQELYINHYKGEEFMRYIPKRSREERIAIFTNVIANYGNPNKLGVWAMINKEKGDLAGVCLLRPYLFDETKTEVGYSIEEKYWGQGFATEMTKAMVDYAFSVQDNPEMRAIIIPENVASGRVLEKAGFVKMEEIERDGLKMHIYWLFENE